jgi:hypothetical protein
VVADSLAPGRQHQSLGALAIMISEPMCQLDLTYAVCLRAILLASFTVKGD